MKNLGAITLMGLLTLGVAYKFLAEDSAPVEKTKAAAEEPSAPKLVAKPKVHSNALPPKPKILPMHPQGSPAVENVEPPEEIPVEEAEQTFITRGGGPSNTVPVTPPDSIEIVKRNLTTANLSDEEVQAKLENDIRSDEAIAAIADVESVSCVDKDCTVELTSKDGEPSNQQSVFMNFMSNKMDVYGGQFQIVTSDADSRAFTFKITRM